MKRCPKCNHNLNQFTARDDGKSKLMFYTRPYDRKWDLFATQRGDFVYDLRLHREDFSIELTQFGDYPAGGNCKHLAFKSFEHLLKDKRFKNSNLIEYTALFDKKILDALQEQTVYKYHFKKFHEKIQGLKIPTKQEIEKLFKYWVED